MAREGQMSDATALCRFPQGLGGKSVSASGPSPLATWERLFDQAAVGVMHVSIDLRVIRANRRVADMLGYAPGDLSGMTVADLTHPDDRLRSKQMVDGLTPERPTYQWEKRYLHKNEIGRAHV